MIKLNLETQRLKMRNLKLTDLQDFYHYRSNPKVTKYQGFETIKAVLAFLFSIEDFHRVSVIIDTENLASIHLFESLNFKREGHFVENIFFNGKWGSEYQYAMLKRNWIKK